MNKFLISLAVVSLIAIPGAVSFSQQHEMQKPPAKEGPGAAGGEMSSGHTMGMMHPMAGMMRPMQGMACPMGMPGSGGMQGGMMGRMMQGTAGGDPKTMGRMMEMRGEMLMKIGEVMMKHAKMWQQESAK